MGDQVARHTDTFDSAGIARHAQIRVRSELGKLVGREIMRISAALTWVSFGVWPRLPPRSRDPARKPTKPIANNLPVPLLQR
jgi:hypothetical protein